jgi:hypothetical protein
MILGAWSYSTRGMTNALLGMWGVAQLGVCRCLSERESVNLKLEVDEPLKFSSKAAD